MRRRSIGLKGGTRVPDESYGIVEPEQNTGMGEPIWAVVDSRQVLVERVDYATAQGVVRLELPRASRGLTIVSNAVAARMKERVHD